MCSAVVQGWIRQMGIMGIMGKPDWTVAQRFSIVSEMLKDDRPCGQKTEKNDNMPAQELSRHSELFEKYEKHYVQLHSNISECGGGRKVESEKSEKS